MVICVATVAMTAGCQTLRSAEQKVSYMTIPPDQEAQLGEQYSKQIEQELTVVDDPEVQRWIDDLGQKLVVHSPQTEQSFTFKVTDDPEINAFAIPGGYCYIQAGLILASDNEAQVAAVVGHEINHVTTRHGVRSLQRAVGFDLLGSALSSGDASQVVGLVQQAGGMVAMRSFGREDERQADQLGVEAMVGAGYDPREAAEFFRKLNKAESGGAPAGSKGVMSFVSSMLSTHPATLERVESIEAQVQQMNLEGKDLKKTTPEFERVRAIISKKVQGEVPKI